MVYSNTYNYNGQKMVVHKNNQLWWFIPIDTLIAIYNWYMFRALAFLSQLWWYLYPISVDFLNPSMEEAAVSGGGFPRES